MQEGIEVLLESYARIKHLVSSRWLHLEKEHFNREHFDPKAVGLAGLQWDSAELFTLTTSISKGDYDAFTLQEVPQELTEKFNYVAGIVPVLSTHIDFLSSDDRDHDRKKMLTQKQSNMVKMSLIELGEWIDNPHSSDRDIKNCQKLLRNLMVV
jgi:inositol 1,4,5-triphosphate receptor type 1